MATRPWTPGGNAPAGAQATSGGSVPRTISRSNPWQAALWRNYQSAQRTNPYSAQWQQGVSQASALGNRDYEGDLRRMAQEDVQAQITRANNQLGSMGMRELALRGDVQEQRAKLAQDATTRAAIEAQGLKSNALETMRGMLSSAQGAELDRLQAMMSAVRAGNEGYQAPADTSGNTSSVNAALRAQQQARAAARARARGYQHQMGRYGTRYNF